MGSLTTELFKTVMVLSEDSKNTIRLCSVENLVILIAYSAH